MAQNSVLFLQDGEGSKIAIYKIQPGTNAPLSIRRFLQLLSLVSLNQLLVGGAAQYLFCRLHVHFNGLTEADVISLPSTPRLLAELGVIMVVEEVFFFYGHWALHRYRPKNHFESGNVSSIKVSIDH